MSNLIKIRPNQNAVYVGYVVADPEMRYTQNGNEVCEVRVGLETGVVGEDGRSINEYISITMWGSAAMYYSFLQKGDWIEIKGEAKNEPYTNNQGEQVDKYKVTGIIAPLPSHIAFRIERQLLKQIGGGQAPQQAPQQQAPQQQNIPTGFHPVDTGDIPF
jgi:single stranded DNA-binding protein